jgi:hypothetical protein
VTSSVGGRLAVEPSQPRGPGMAKYINFFKLCVFAIATLQNSHQFNTFQANVSKTYIDLKTGTARDAIIFCTILQSFSKKSFKNIKNVKKM